MFARLLATVAALLLACASPQAHAYAQADLVQSDLDLKTALPARARAEQPASGQVTAVTLCRIYKIRPSAPACASAHKDYANNNPLRYIDPDGQAAAIAWDAVGELAAKRTATALGTAMVDSPVPGPADVVAIGVLLYGLGEIGYIIYNSDETPSADGENPSLPDAPGSLVGEQDNKSGAQGGRQNSGSLSPGNGGTGDAATDFDKLTGGKSGPAPDGSRYPEGTKIGENGIALRPGTDKKGPRIDIPAQGEKPHETLHYPKKR